MIVRALGRDDGPALAALFDAAGSPCFCRYWHFDGDKNAWLSRCYAEGTRNRDDLAEVVAGEAPESRGLLAVEEAAGVVGWLKVCPAERAAKAYEQRLYRGLRCFDGERRGVHLLACTLVHPAHRRRGIFRALVRGAIELAPAWGATALEALPRRPREPVHDEELWVGHARVLLEEGFTEVHAFEPYPVLRRALGGASPP